MKKIITLSIALFSAMSFASEDISDHLKSCRAEQDSLKRLMCYDALADDLPQAVTKKARVEVEKVDKIEKAVATSAKQQVATKPLEETVTVKSAAKEKAVSAEAIFGNEYKPKPNENRVDEVTFVIKSVKQSARKTWKFVFENGQRWDQKDDSYVKFNVGEKVQIKRGVFNSFYLKKIGSNRTIRVKRVY